MAFYDALETNDSAVKVLGAPTLKKIARELASHVRNSVTIDWTLRESAQAQIRVLVRRRCVDERGGTGRQVGAGKVQVQPRLAVRLVAGADQLQRLGLIAGGADFFAGRTPSLGNSIFRRAGTGCIWFSWAGV